MPDSSIMLELCNILDVTVNELLSGERIEMNNYEEKVSENLIELKRKDENNMNKNTIIKSQALNAKNITGFCVLSFSQFPFCFFVHIQQPSNFAISSLKRSSAVP